MTRMMSRQMFDNAARFMRQSARPLERAIFEYHFGDGHRTNVLAELVPYQNEDGGFGNALESDIRAPASSVIATVTALAVLRDIGATEDTPGLPAALTYLMDSYDVTRERWPIVPPEVEEAPHAPWWTYAESEETFRGFWANPRAAVVSYLWQFRKLVPSPFVESALEAIVADLMRQPQRMEMHDLLAFVDLLETPELPEEAYQGVLDKLLRALPRSVVADPAQWDGYNLKPIAVVSRPDSPLATAFDPAIIEANLDYEIDRLPAEGVWSPNWSWDFVDADAWAAAEREWQGVVTLRKLRILHNYGRIEGLT
jgi:hypothetical protein